MSGTAAGLDTGACLVLISLHLDAGGLFTWGREKSLVLHSCLCIIGEVDETTE